jgi:hypothetical protein
LLVNTNATYTDQFVEFVVWQQQYQHANLLPTATQVFVLSQLGDVAAVVRACTASAALQRLLREAA